MFLSVWRHLLLPSAYLCQNVLTVRSRNNKCSANRSVVKMTTQLPSVLRRERSQVHISSGQLGQQQFTAGSVKRSVQYHVLAQSRHHACAPVINIQLTLRTAPDLCKNVPLLCYVVATVYKWSLHAVKYVHTYTCSSQFDSFVGKNKLKIRTSMNATCPRNLSACRRFVTPASQHPNVCHSSRPIRRK
jgi:hypothetical protein